MGRTSLFCRLVPVQALVLTLLSGCHFGQEPQEPVEQFLAPADIAQRLPPRVRKDRDGWALDLSQALAAAHVPATAEHVCAAIAVVDQESGFVANPVVPDLPRIVRQGLLEKLAPLGPLAQPALDLLLKGKAPGSNLTFAQRIARLTTERDLDRFFRDIQAAYAQGFPGPYALASGLSRLLDGRRLEALNPITTAGSMQVKVSFAKTLPELDDLEDGDLREYLFTRAGGLRVGVARLLSYPAHYDEPRFRFADYNAGIYASRNAAFQKLLKDLTGQPLALDGDLQRYAADGEPLAEGSKSLHAMLVFGRLHDLWEWPIQRAVRQEKTLDFEETDIWHQVRAAWSRRFGQKPPYARIPEVAIVSPKMARGRTTAWFASRVQARFEACRNL